MDGKIQEKNPENWGDDQTQEKVLVPTPNDMSHQIEPHEEGTDIGKPAFGEKPISEIETDQQVSGTRIQGDVPLGQNHATSPSLSKTPKKWMKIERPQNFNIEITESLLAEGARHKRKNTVALGSTEEDVGGSGKQHRSMEVAHPITVTMAAAWS